MTELKTISPVDLRERDTVLDVRHRVGSMQIRGALRYDPTALLSEQHITLPLPLESRVVLHTDRDEEPQRIAERLHGMGVHEVVALNASIDEVHDAGLPLERPTQEQPVPEHPDAGIRRL
jgi:hypothetical protein